MSPMEVLVDLHLSTDLEFTLDEVEALARARPDDWRPSGGFTHAGITDVGCFRVDWGMSCAGRNG
jgi:hypothetical protein